MTSLLWIAVGGLGGAAAGPLVRAAVIEHSVPAGEAWRYSCPTCGDVLIREGARRLTGLMPPTGRCPACRGRIGPPPAAVEVATMATVALIGGVLGPHPATLAIAWAALIGIILGFVDLAVHRLPDRLVGVGLVGTIGLLAVATVDDGSPRRLLAALVCGAAIGAGYGLLVAFSPRGSIGAGDAKVSVLTGVATGWFGVPTAVYGVLLGVLLAGASAIVLLVSRRANRRTAVPFGPFILVGALAAIVVFG